MTWPVALRQQNLDNSAKNGGFEGSVVMMKDSQRKMFTAELQRLKAKGTAIVESLPAQPANSTDSASNSEVLSAITALRTDMRAIEQLIRGDDADGGNSLADQEFQRKRAEVNMLKTEVRALSLCIQQTKAEIAALRPSNSEDDRLIAVSNELDAIVTATERATHGILEAAEKIDNVAQQLQAQAGDSFSGHLAAEIAEHVVGIFEQCNFQDITGQRITKAVKTLQYIEDRINKMIEIWGPDTFEDLPTPPEVEPDDERKLLNGPALENQGISQADIDKLFD